MEIRLGGRTLGKALPFESERVKIVKVDNTTDDPLRNLDDNFTLVVNAVNDPQDRLLLSAVRKKFHWLTLLVGLNVLRVLLID